MNQKIIGKITSINGSVIKVEGFSYQSVGDMVNVSEELNIIGEIIKILDNIAVIQCYEETLGLKLNAIVTNLQYPLSMELGPGLLNSIYDGIQRPLDYIAEITGDFISRGMKVNALDREKKWHFIPSVNNGEVVNEGDIIGYVQEYSLHHEIMVPQGLSGTISGISEGDFNIVEKICSIKNKDKIYDQKILSKWPIRIPRPYHKRLMPDRPLITGTRVFDLLFQNNFLHFNLLHGSIHRASRYFFC